MNRVLLIKNTNNLYEPELSLIRNEEKIDDGVKGHCTLELKKSNGSVQKGEGTEGNIWEN